jgi:hypothetical protein
MAAALATPAPSEQCGAPEVYKAICQVARAVSRQGIAKSGRNQQQNYAFRGIDQIMNSLSALLADADLCILPRMVSRTQEERTTAKGGVLFYVTVHAQFAFVSARDGSRHTVAMYGEAMDSADKATNKAMSAAYKYACLQVFCIPTEAMPDADATTPEPAPRSTGRGPTAAQQEVAEAKIATMMARKPPQPAAEMGEQIPEPQDEDRCEYPSQLEQDLHDSIALVEAARARTGKQPSGKFTYAMLQAFGELKSRYKSIDALKTYYAILGLYGARHANEFEDSEEGIAQARCAYKEMSLDIANREVRGRR